MDACDFSLFDPGAIDPMSFCYSSQRNRYSYVVPRLDLSLPTFTCRYPNR